MTTVTSEAPAAAVRPGETGRGSPVPTPGMIRTKFMELRKRRGLMIALVVVNIGIPTLFLVIRLIAHAAAPKSYGPAGGYDIYSGLTAQVMYVFGFIVAATVGCTAGSSDLTEGMFRHLVVTGRSRIALYLARIPAGLAVIWPMIAAGFAIVCFVCVFAAPTTLDYQGVKVPYGLSLSGFESWAEHNVDSVICGFPYGPRVDVQVPCGPNGKIQSLSSTPGGGNGVVVSSPGRHKSVIVGPGTTSEAPSALRAGAKRIARADYSDYHALFLYPSDTLMIETGLWIVLEATIGFIVGLGLASLLGQRTIAVVLMIVLEVILTPIFARVSIPHLINLQRAVVGLATAHLEPSVLPIAFGGGGPGNSNTVSSLVPETRTVAVIVIVAWAIGWTVIGAWRMRTRDV